MDLLDHFETAERALTQTRENHEAGDDLAALRCMGVLREEMVEILFVLAQLAFDKGATKKAMALALDIPPSTFRGLEKSR